MKQIVKTIIPINVVKLTDINSSHPLIGIEVDQSDGVNCKYILVPYIFSDGTQGAAFVNSESRRWDFGHNINALLETTMEDDLVKGMYLFDNINELASWTLSVGECISLI